MALEKKKSPEKSFTETDKYTLHLPDGTCNLVIEDTLAHIESQFVGVIERLHRREALKQEDKVHLCAFAAAMHTRTTAMGNHWKSQPQRLHDQIVELEEAHNVTPETSVETAEMVEHAHLHLIAFGLMTEVPLLYQMAMTILFTNDELGFITSDTPCVWFNPKLYKLPPFCRSPGLAQPDIEVTLPLTPQHLLVISHNWQLPAFVDVAAKVVTEFNRRTRFHCSEEFVSCKYETRPEWFDTGTEPEDTWENSPEGRRAIKDTEEMKKWAVGGERPACAMPPAPSEEDDSTSSS